jgi:N6-adenosine-specific RNA methylase IME4/ParB-like chromosome segregation protein Spo0J
MSNIELRAVGLERRQPGELLPHPQAAEVPIMSERDYRALRDDVAARGLVVPLEVTAGGTLLDGRARLRAARELGHETVEVIVVRPTDELEHILRAALHRRHLDASQRAALALKLVNFEQLRAEAEERRRANLRRGPEVATLPARDEAAAQGRTRDLIATTASTSPRTAQDVITVHAHDPELFEQILRGDRKANAAANQVRQALRDAELPAAPPLPDGPFELIYADPPWRLPGSPDSSRAVENHYPTMPLAEIKGLQVPAAGDALLFLWGVNSMTGEALDVIKAWGFTYLGNFAWVKDKWGLGQYNRCQHELLHIGRRGTYPPPPTNRRQSSVIDARRGRHSAKPTSVYDLLDAMYPHASKLELFARGQGRPGWTSWGNETVLPGPAR